MAFEEMEAALAEDPFNLDLRANYANSLMSAEQYEEALKQWRLLEKQSPSAEVFFGLVRCLLRKGDEEAARTAHARGRVFDSYLPCLERLSEAERTTLEPPQKAAPLRLIEGGAPPPEGRVVSIHRAEKIRFSDIAGMDELKKILRLRIIEPFLRPGLFQRFKRKAGGGVLLYGPPGCGKTMMARAIATECDASFTAIGISDVLNMFIGESERNLSQIFEKARSERPAVLFFDELDALAFSRSKANSDHTRTMVNEFLNQLDGVGHQNDGLLILGATNLPWDVDSAMKRPGRFDRQIFVPPPDATARQKMFEMKLLDVPTSALGFQELARATQGFSGADIDGVIEMAKDSALIREMDSGAHATVDQGDLMAAAQQAEASTTDWLKTARNLVKFGGAGSAYKDVEKYLREARMY